MKITLISLAHSLEPWAQEAIAQYQKRLPPDWPLTLKPLKPEPRAGAKPGSKHGSNPGGKTKAQLLAAEAKRIRAAVPAGHTLVALDERGQALSSVALAKQLGSWHHNSQALCLLIGSADGLDPELLASCDARWRLSDLTLPHALAQVLAVEALYRAWSIHVGHPYHRE